MCTLVDGAVACDRRRSRFCMSVRFLLHYLQRNTAATFRAAYSAVRNIPSAAAVLRKHAVQARELQHQVR
jgi:hypothetical protein